MLAHYREVVKPTLWRFTTLLWLLYPVLGAFVGASAGLLLGALLRRHGGHSTGYRQAAAFGLVAAYLAATLWTPAPPGDLRRLVALGVGVALLAASSAPLLWPRRAGWIQPVIGPWPLSLLLLGAPLAAGYESWNWKIAAAVLASVGVAAAAGDRLLGADESRAVPIRHLAGLALAMPAVLGAILLAVPDPPQARPDTQAPPAGGRPNVVVAVMDTVRADHLSLYGYSRDTTPWLRTLAGEATVYRRVFAPSNFTLPGHASLFTGLYPRAHGAILYPPRAALTLPLEADRETLAEILNRNGYRTLAVVANTAFLRRDYGLMQGFQFLDAREPVQCLPLAVRYGLRPAVRELLALAWDTQRLDERFRDAAAITTAGIEALEKAGEAGRPFFLFLNYMDAHEPYVPPAPYDRLFPGKNPRKTYQDYVKLVEDVVSEKRPIRTAEREHFVSQYDGAIAYIDAELRRLAGYLKQRGLWDKTIFVVTSDHGETFGEHNFVGHTQSLYQPELSVPLIIRYPGQTAPEAVDVPASLVDVMPTILTATGLRAPAEIHGRSLLAPEALADRPVFAEAYTDNDLARLRPRHPDSQLAVFHAGLKLIVSAGGGEELYDLERDPEERRNLASADGAALQAVRRRLDELLERVPFQAKLPKSVDPKELERLRNLGYIR